MSDDESRRRAEEEALAEQRAEAESFTIGPGVTGTKSQMRGGIGGLVLGTLVGAVLGLIVGVIIGGAQVTIITVIVGAVAGCTAGGVIGGFLRPRQKLEGGEADT
jgi:outer membrane lipoprotein SlyB